MFIRLLTTLLLSLTLALAGCGGHGAYSGSASSSAPTITTEPSSATVATGATAVFSVVASGDSLTYQWYKDGSTIAGATSASHTIASATSSDAGSYYVIVSNDVGSVTSSTVTLTVSDSTASSACTGGTYVENVVCAVDVFEATLTASQWAQADYSASEYTTAQLNVYKTLWSNLPESALADGRAGLAYGDLDTSEQINAFFAVADTALTDAGYADFLAVLAADDYLGTMQSGYGSEYAHIAVIGTPSTTGQWTLMLGNHHMVYVITFYDGVAYPTPHHIGVEPKAAFTIDGKTYQALADKAAGMLAIFYGQSGSLSSSQLSAARLSATYGDILLGPVEYGTGSYAAVAAKYPTSNRGLLVSSLNSAQQALVTAAITQWASDYDASVTSDLVAAYTSSSAYASTYVAWSGTSSESYPNVDNTNTYMRIDGPRVWIEIACQDGVVISGKTHYHMIFRDKTTDYYNELSTD